MLVPAALAVLVGFWGYARAAWAMTASQRAAGREAVRCAPARLQRQNPAPGAAPQPRRARRLRAPAALMGFPGVGWLFAGFPLAASILLMPGPATTWAGVPLLFSPYGGPLRDVGWKLEFVYLPVSALLSAASSTAPIARRRARLDGTAAAWTAPQVARRTARVSGSRSAPSRCCSSRCRSFRRLLVSARAECATRTRRRFRAT